MTPVAYLGISWVGNIVMFVVGIWLIKRYITEVKHGVDESMKIAIEYMTNTFDRQIAHCSEKFDTIEGGVQGCWDAVNSHGHKGLDKEGSKVTR